MPSCQTRIRVSAYLGLKAKDCLCSQGIFRRQVQCLLYVILQNKQEKSFCITMVKDSRRHTQDHLAAAG